MTTENYIFTLKEVIPPNHTLTSFGYRTTISPDGNTIVVLDPENSFVTFYSRSSLDTNTPFVFSNQFSKPEFKHQYILTDVIFNDACDKCFVGVKYCDYVNYDTDIRRSSFLISGILYYKQIIQVPKMLENTVIYEERALWSFFIGLPYVDQNGFERLYYSSINDGLYAITKTFGDNIKMYFQPLAVVNFAIQYNSTQMITIETPELVSNIYDIRHIDFARYKKDYVYDRDCILINYLLKNDRNVYRRNIINKSLETEEFITDNVYNFSAKYNMLVCDKLTHFELINLDRIEIQRVIEMPQMMDMGSIFTIYNNILVQASNINNKLVIYDEKEFSYSNGFPFTCANFDRKGKTLISGQPKNGKILVFYRDEENTWSLYQELSLIGFGHKFDIDGEEKTLVVSNKSTRTTEIYENVSYDLSSLVKSSVEIENHVDTRYSDKYYLSSSFGYKNVVINYLDFNTDPPAILGVLYSPLPYYIPSDGNVIFSIYESIWNERYYYHIYGNELSGNQFDTTSKLLIYSQSGIARLRSITSDRTGDTILLLREDNLVQLYKKVNTNQTDEIYVFVGLEVSDFRDIWTNKSYNPFISENIRTPIDHFRFNNRGNIIVVQHDKDVIVLHYEQELMFRMKVIDSSMDENLLPSFTEYGNVYNYFRNIYFLLSQPNITYILNEQFMSIDENNTIYTRKNNFINIYREDNYYKTKVSSLSIPNHIESSTIQFFPEEKLFTYKDVSNIYIYYYDVATQELINMNVKLPVSERYHIIENHIIQYSDKNLKIHEYTIDIYQNQDRIDFSHNILYTDSIDTSYNFQKLYMDNKNHIHILFTGIDNSKFYHYIPLSKSKTKYKHITTFREQKIDVDIQYKYEEFYNNVIQVLPNNYVEPNNLQENNSIQSQNMNQFKIYCPQMFNYNTETNNSEIHVFYPNFNKQIYYSDQFVVAKHFDPTKYTTLNSVLRYMNTINDNRAMSLFRITEKRYVGIVANMKGGTNSVRYKYTLLENGKENILIHSPPYVQEVNEKIHSIGAKFYQVTDDVYKDLSGGSSNIYEFSEVPIRSPVQIRYDVNLSNSEDTVIRHPENIYVYLMSELTIDIITDETVYNFLNSTLNVTNTNGSDIEYGNFTNISYDGNLIVIGSNMDTLSNTAPMKTTNKMEFRLWIEETFIDSEADFSIGGGEGTLYNTYIGNIDNWNQSRGGDDIRFNINWDVGYKGKDDGLEEFIDLTKYDRVEKIEDYVNGINSYYGNTLVKMKYDNYYAIIAHEVGGIGGRRMWFSADDMILIKTEDHTSWGTSSTEPTRSPHYNNDTDVIRLTGVDLSPYGGVISGNSYVLSPKTSRPTSFLYRVWYTGGTECYAKNINISYVFVLTLTFTEEYLQRYHYNLIKYGCLFYYVKQKGRWRHLNTLSPRYSYLKGLRRVASIQTKPPQSLLIIDKSKLLVSDTNKKHRIYLNGLIEKDINNLFLTKNFIPPRFDIEINYLYDFEIKVKEIRYEFEPALETSKNVQILYNETITIDITSDFLSEIKSILINKCAKSKPGDFLIEFSPRYILSEGAFASYSFNRLIAYPYSNRLDINNILTQPIFRNIETYSSGLRTGIKIYLNTSTEPYDRSKFGVLDDRNNIAAETHPNSKYNNKNMSANHCVVKAYWSNFNPSDYPNIISWVSTGNNASEKFAIIRPDLYISGAWLGLSSGLFDSDEIRNTFDIKFPVYTQQLRINFKNDIYNVFNKDSKEIILNQNTPEADLIITSPNFIVYNSTESRNNLGGIIQKSENTIHNPNYIIGGINKFELYLLKTQELISKFKINDKIGNLYLQNNKIYNCIPERGLIRYYNLPSQIDLSFNTTLNGTQLFQDYNYSNFGNTLSIFNDTYAVIGTTEGKVIIQHLTDKNSSKAVINSGNPYYTKFGSVLRSGKYIYINSPEQNKIYIVDKISYYE